MMRAFLATVLSVIAVGVLLIAYGLFNPRVAAVGANQLQTPVRCSRANAWRWSKRGPSPQTRRIRRISVRAGLQPDARDGVPGERRARGAAVYETLPGACAAARRLQGTAARRATATPRRTRTAAATGRRPRW